MNFILWLWILPMLICLTLDKTFGLMKFLQEKGIIYDNDMLLALKIMQYTPILNIFMAILFIRMINY